MLSSLKAGDRTITDIEDLTGMHPDYVRRWLRAFESVGLIEQAGVRKTVGQQGKPPVVWRMP
jgi:DNA-binding IclR family transcriptional regulator